MNINILGYSKIHFCIVAVEAKGKKATKAGKDAAIAKTMEGNPHRHVISATFSRVDKVETVPLSSYHVYLVEYVRPAKEEK